MPTTPLKLKAELHIKPGHEAAVAKLHKLVAPEDYEVFTLTGDLLEIDLDSDVPCGHYHKVMTALEPFVAAHCSGGGAFQIDDSERGFITYGATDADRLAAHHRYCDNELLYWTNVRDNIPD